MQPASPHKFEQAAAASVNVVKSEAEAEVNRLKTEFLQAQQRTQTQASDTVNSLRAELSQSHSQNKDQMDYLRIVPPAGFQNNPQRMTAKRLPARVPIT